MLCWRFQSLHNIGSHLSFLFILGVFVAATHEIFLRSPPYLISVFGVRNSFPDRIEFKIAVLTYTRTCAGAGVHRLFHRFCRLTQSPIAAFCRHQSPGSAYQQTVDGSRAFPVAGPQTWNDLPEDVTSAESLTTHISSPPQDTSVQEVFTCWTLTDCLRWTLQ